MDSKFKTKGKLAKEIGRKSMMFIPDCSKDCASSKFKFKGAETTRSLNHIGLKKSLSHFNVDIDPLFVPVQTSRNSINDKSTKFDVLSRRLSLPVKLQPSPVILPQVSSRFIHNLSRLEQKLKLFYLNQNYI